MSSHQTITRVLLNMPSLLPTTLPSETPARSWIQLAKVGSFTSNRYGSFEISREDLAMMSRNFHEVMPKPPTELPIDFDHLSIDVKKPGDGIAAGWLKALQLRKDGDELWGLAEWTPRAAEAIRNREYRFISPSFVKDFTDTHSGRKIGTTLLAAAVTNHPFLQAMSGLSLYNDEIMGNVALNAKGVPPSQEHSMTRSFHLASIGDNVSFIEDDTKTPELTPKERADTFVVKAVVDAGDQQFVRLETLDGGKEFGWFVADQLGPAPALNKKTAPPANLEPVTPTTAEEAAALAAVTGKRQKVVPPMPPKEEEKKIAMSDTEANHQLIALASTRAREKGIRLSDAVKQISSEQFHLVAIRDGHRPSSPVTSTPISLHATQPTSFYDRVMTLKAERKIGDLEAINLAQQLYPDAAQRYANGEF
jgi:hypothetical protein